MIVGGAAMTPENALRMTLPRAISMDFIPGSFAADKLLAFGELHGLRDDAYQFVAAKYLGEGGAAVKSIGYLNKKAVKKYNPSKAEEKALKLACMLAIGQHIDPQRWGVFCYQCLGSGNQDAGVTCQACDGERFKPMPAEWFANILSVTSEAFNKKWSRIVDDLYTEAGFWEGDMWKLWNDRLDAV
jgi:hypothetical protein